LLSRIQQWYKTNCNGDWEHSLGLSITNIDNPGWAVKIDLLETCLENLQFNKKVDNSNWDWYQIKVVDKVLEMYCGHMNLDDVLKIFLDEIIPKHADSNFLYDIYIPLSKTETKLWRPAKAKMLTEEILEITELPVMNYSEIRSLNVNDIPSPDVDFSKYQQSYFVGDKVTTALVNSFDGIKLLVKEKVNLATSSSS